MQISLICVGKIKKQYLKDFVDDYKKRCEKYAKIEIIELKDEVLRDESKQGIIKLLETEAKNIEKYLQENSYKICLAIEGEHVDSEKFALTLENSFNKNAHIQFIIGGSYGISEQLKNKCDKKLSFSKMTFPHQMMRGMVLEQIYRCFKINNNESYHK